VEFPNGWNMQLREVKSSRSIGHEWVEEDEYKIFWNISK
jgi:hypothetical protein